MVIETTTEIGSVTVIYGSRIFAVSGPACWNLHPSSLKSLSLKPAEDSTHGAAVVTMLQDSRGDKNCLLTLTLTRVSLHGVFVNYQSAYLCWLVVGGGGSPVKPLTANTGSTELHGMDGVVMNQSLLELAAAGWSDYIVSSSLSSLSSDRQHLSYDVCLEVRGEIIRTVLCCIVYWSCTQS